MFNLNSLVLDKDGTWLEATNCAKSHYGKARTRIRIWGISSCKKSHNRLLYRDKFVRTSDEEAKKKKGVTIHHRRRASKE